MLTFGLILGTLKSVNGERDRQYGGRHLPARRLRRREPVVLMKEYVPRKSERPASALSLRNLPLVEREARELIPARVSIP